MNLMSKERLIAFTDAVLAIIMTILVLELERPNQISWQALWDLRTNFFAYTISFFWLGTMWVNLHRSWDVIDKINSNLVWSSIVLLFFYPFSPTPQTWLRLILTIQLLKPSMGSLFFWYQLVTFGCITNCIN